MAAAASLGSKIPVSDLPEPPKMNRSTMSFCHCCRMSWSRDLPSAAAVAVDIGRRDGQEDPDGSGKGNCCGPKQSHSCRSSWQHRPEN